MDFLAAAATTTEQLDWADFAWIAFSLAIFAYLIRRVFQPGGDAVDTSHYGGAETGVAVTLAAWFILQGTLQFLSPPPDASINITLTDLLLYEAMIVVFTTVVILVLKSRGSSLSLLFGLGRQPVWKAVILALIFIFAAYPVVQAGALLTQLFSKGPDDLQEIVKFFRGAGRDRERLTVVFTAVFVAPVAEELFFRGVIYGVAKRYGGLTAALIFNASLFAFIHGSLPAFGGLFVLAVCLTLAYEFTGSLLVPIFMHACFNAGELALMFFGLTKP